MSAIGGIVRLDGGRVDPAALERMESVLALYGRDARNRRNLGSTGFVRTLLRSTPEDRLDRQPLVHEASGTVLVFDGRIDNREELAEALGLTPAELRLMADSAVVLRACLQWGPRAPEHLLGDFAFACWEPRDRRLWLARDPLGVRPLFWHRQEGFFAFATMPKGLFALPGVPRELSEERLHDFLTLLPPVGPYSFFEGIQRVEPAHTVILHDDGRTTSHRHHEFDPERELRLGSDDEYVEAVRAELERAVAAHLRAIGPVATHLSSGFDSSTVTAIAARQLAARGEGLIAYTAVPREGFDGPVPRGTHGDEGPGAKAVARRFPNVEHVLVRPDSNGTAELIEEYVRLLDRPPLNPCNLGWAAAIQQDAAQRGVRVMLNGALGNFTVSYEGVPYLAQLLARGRWIALARELRAAKRNYPDYRWRWLVELAVAPHMPRPLWRAWQRRRGNGWETLTDHSAVHPEFMAREGTRARARSVGHDLTYQPRADGRWARIAGLGLVDFGEYTVADDAVGVVWRAPLADVRLIQLCLALPMDQYYRRGRPRHLVRRLTRDILPPEVLEGRTRGFQAADWFESLRAELPALRGQLDRLDRHDRAGELLDVNGMRAAVEDWPAEGWARLAARKRYRLRLLRGLSAGAMVRYVDDANV